jgi:hypothetical protein
MSSLDKPRPLLFNNVTGLGEVQRTPTCFKSLPATAAGTTAIWTPPSAKKFRLMGGILTLSKEAACAANFLINFLDNAVDMKLYFTISTGALVAIGNVVLIPFSFPGNGYLSVLAGNALNVNLSGALTAGNLYVTVWGTEE